jgi:hypothetical protein
LRSSSVCADAVPASITITAAAVIAFIRILP